nr:hypothetical protein [Morchella crassipes]
MTIPPPLRAEREKSRRSVGVRGARQRMVRQTPPPSQRRGGGVRWKVEGGGERGAASPPSLSPPPSIHLLSKIDWIGGAKLRPSLFSQQGGFPPPEHKAKA